MTTEIFPPKYWLSRHVHLCAVPDGVVLLDLKKDRYFAVAGTYLCALCHTVVGWPKQPAAEDVHHATVPPEQVATAAQRLIAEGFLTANSADGKSAAPVTLVQLDMTDVSQHVTRVARIRIGHLANFLVACASASFALRWQSLESVVERVAARKRQAVRAGLRGFPYTAAQLAMIFRRLRCYVYTRKDRCLFDALALINFLARYDQFPLWVIGVQSRPFAAHSWVQTENIVLDDTPDRVYDYTPILAV